MHFPWKIISIFFSPIVYAVRKLHSFYYGSYLVLIYMLSFCLFFCCVTWFVYFKGVSCFLYYIFTALQCLTM